MIKQINVGVIGTGWCGGIRANACHLNPLVDKLYIAETNESRLNELKGKLELEQATHDWKLLTQNPDIDTIIISATPEDTHYPMALQALKSGKNVFLEKPIATTMDEAEELIEVSIKNNVKFTIGYSQRFNSKYAYVKKTIDEVISCFSGCDMIFLSFDVDSLDPTVSSGTGTPVENGFTENEMIEILDLLTKSNKISCMEITEINPTLDNRNKMSEAVITMLDIASNNLSKVDLSKWLPKT